MTNELNNSSIVSHFTSTRMVGSYIYRVAAEGQEEVDDDNEKLFPIQRNLCV